MTIQELHNNKVRDIAERYRQLGYVVVLEPPSDSIPGFDRSLHPDLLAKKGPDNVVVEVRSRGALRNSDTVRRMADALARQVGWRFELIVLDDAAAQPNAAIDADGVRTQLTTATQLQGQGQPASAFVLAWIAAEAVLRRLAQTHGLDSADPSPIRLIRDLTFNGFLADEDYELLNRQFQIRNQIVHGYDSPKLTADEVANLLALATRLLEADVSQPAAA